MYTNRGSVSGKGDEKIQRNLYLTCSSLTSLNRIISRNSYIHFSEKILLITKKHFKLVRGKLKADFIPVQMVQVLPCGVFHEDALSFQLHKQLSTCSYNIQLYMSNVQWKHRPTKCTSNIWCLILIEYA